MEYVKSLIIIMMTSVLVNNYVLNKFLGICPAYRCVIEWSIISLCCNERSSLR